MSWEDIGTMFNGVQLLVVWGCMKGFGINFCGLFFYLKEHGFNEFEVYFFEELYLIYGGLFLNDFPFFFERHHYGMLNIKR
jgi:hypothetical protein